MAAACDCAAAEVIPSKVLITDENAVSYELIPQSLLTVRPP